MATFDRGETVICSATVKTTAGVLYDPADSMKITITNYINSIEVDDQAMTKDSTGEYHYDWTSLATADKGTYTAIYKATDGTRITIQKDIFEVA